MKSIALFATVVLIATAAAPSRAGDNFQDSIGKGDEHRGSGRFDQALAEYDLAAGQAVNNTERGIAHGKKAEVQAFDRKDYAAARIEAEKCLALPDVHPVGQVIGLKSLAECQLKKDNNPETAALTLEKAMKLEGVDWAKPTLLLPLGDCYRMTARPEQAIEAYEKVITLAGDNQGLKAVCHLNIGLTRQYNLQDAAKARTAYEQAVALDPALKAEVEKHLATLP